MKFKSLLPRAQIKITIRLAVFLAVVSLPIFWFSYVFLDEKLSGGVHPHGDYTEVELKALGDFYFSAESGTTNDVPKLYRQLDGKRVALEGFMFAGNSAADDVDNFEFVYNITKCCFNGPPLVQERVFVNVPSGTVPYYSKGLARITGVMHVNAEREGGGVIKVYTLDLERLDWL